MPSATPLLPLNLDAVIAAAERSKETDFGKLNILL